MEDSEIVQLYWDRDSRAINVTAEKYGSYCHAIALNILGNQEDAEECVNDAYLGAWYSIPPQRPAVLSTYLGKIIRNLSLDRYRYYNAQKRRNSEIKSVLDELSECISNTSSVEQELDRKALIAAINAFLTTLSAEHRDIFLYRYWYTIPVKRIAKKYHKTTGNISVILNRTRQKLKDYLKEGGFEL
ncbi:MAG: sigma-70 family RNA polymerase sigma factor [Lachnospiraceae bacterium]|nr:sigma-70 family RNA polymerase sigma factor [Lachnospiraceae bacterium]